MTAQVEKRKYNSYCRECGKPDERDSEGQCRKCGGLNRVRLPVNLFKPTVKLTRDK